MQYSTYNPTNSIVPHCPKNCLSGPIVTRDQHLSSNQKFTITQTQYKSKLLSLKRDKTRKVVRATQTFLPVKIVGISHVARS